MTEAECAALIKRGAQHIAQWRAANAQARKLAEDAQQAAEAQAERQRANAAYWAAHDAAKPPAGNVLVYKRGER